MKKTRNNFERCHRAYRRRNRQTDTEAGKRQRGKVSKGSKIVGQR